MNTGDEKLTKFEQAVLAEAKEEIDKLLQDADLEKQKVLEKADNECLQQSYDKIKENIKKIEGIYVKRVAQFELDCKKAVLKHREELVGKIFEDIVNRLASFTQSGEYVTYLVSQLTNALQSDDSKDAQDIQVLCRPCDLQYAPQLEAGTSVPIRVVADTSIRYGGLSVLLGSKSMMIDKTLDTALEEERARFNQESGFTLS